MQLLRFKKRSVSVPLIVILAGAIAAAAQSNPRAPLHDGLHDFDFHFGNWHTHIRRLMRPLTGSNTWIELDGTVRVHPLWDGRANVEELEASNATVHFQGMTLFLYNPDAHQWTQTFANASDGVLTRSLTGRFVGGRGELYDQETVNGKAVYVRFLWSDITADSHHVEQAFSDDGGKTWEPNFVATLTRIK